MPAGPVRQGKQGGPVQEGSRCQCCQIPASLHCHLGTFHGQIFFITATFSAIFLYFLPLLLTDPAATGVFAIEVMASPTGVPCLASLFAARILADANIHAVACFPAVAGMS
jgi:hypothetical protein